MAHSVPMQRKRVVHMMTSTLIGAAMLLGPADYVGAAIATCKNSIKSPDRQMMIRVLDEEVKAGWPSKYRGSILAAACRESGFNPTARGDCTGGGVCKAVGLLQLWPWAERRYGIDRTNPVASARVWARQIAKTVKKAKRKGCRRPWVVAWAWVASGPKGWSCNRAPRHLSQLKKMKRFLRYKRSRSHDQNN